MALPPTAQQEASDSVTALKEGQLVVFEQDGQAQLAVITSSSGRKVKVLSMRGRSIDLPVTRLDTIPGKVPTELSSTNERAEFLLSERDKALDRAIHFPVEELWSFVQLR